MDVNFVTAPPPECCCPSIYQYLGSSIPPQVAQMDRFTRENLSPLTFYVDPLFQNHDYLMDHPMPAMVHKMDKFVTEFWLQILWQNLLCRHLQKTELLNIPPCYCFASFYHNGFRGNMQILHQRSLISMQGRLRWKSRACIYLQNWLELLREKEYL